MKKRFLGVIVAIAMIVCAIPMTASAFACPVEIGGVGVHQSGTVTGTGITGTVTVKYYDAAGAEITEVDSYDVAAAVITLDGAAISCANDNAIKCSIPAEIVLVGNNSATVTEAVEDDAITGTGLRFSGSGQLDITCDSANCDNCRGINADAIEFTEAVKINVSSSGGSVYADEITFKLGVGGKVDATSKNDVAIEAPSPSTIVIADDNKITTPAGGINYKDQENGCWYIANADKTPASHAVIEGVAPAAKGANTADSNELAMFGILAVLALAGAGFVGYKKREN